MQTIHAGNMKKSAFIRSQLEACKIGQKDKKIFLNKPFSTSKNGDQNRFKSTRRFFHMPSGHFSNI